MKKPYKIACGILLTLIVSLSGLLVLYLQNTVTVTFDTQGGTIYRAVEIKPNSEVARPVDPVKEGHVFAGWYIGKTNERFDFSTKILEDITITAKWESVI